jgi:hypothetical protein
MKEVSQWKRKHSDRHCRGYNVVTELVSFFWNRVKSNKNVTERECAYLTLIEAKWYRCNILKRNQRAIHEIREITI